jgi:TonB family protein
MKQRAALLTLIVAAACLSAAVEHAWAQSAHRSDVPQSAVALIKLYDPTYPPLARQARITGDVDLILTIRKDGSVESATVVSGHPMLKQAALDSAQRSQFECGGCGEAVASHAMKYKFQIIYREYPKDCDAPTEKQPPAEVDLSRHQVTVSAWAIAFCGDPASRILKIRSAKCLYLWRCSTRYEL